MSLRSDWPCWEIMKCEPQQARNCPAYMADKPCWEVMRDINACSFNVCKDCIVYVTKQKNSIFSQEEIWSIMSQKGVDIIGKKCSGAAGVGR
ncbi:MAG: hypothetical protein OEV64_15510 [Desulfobulbaceae bacterium]|nr:hypothetical protein [Desulfobulbaceae bacterium]